MTSMTVNWRKTATEFVVIVAGVLAALAVDQWRDYRSDRETEAEYLGRLRIDLNADIKYYSDLERIFETKARIIKDIRDNEVAVLLSRQPEDLMQDLVYSGYTSLPPNRSATFDELVSTGNLALVQDLTLLDALSQYYKANELISKIFLEPVGDYRRLMYGAMPGELANEWRLAKKIDDLDGLRRGLEALQSDPGLESAANIEIRYAGTLIFYLRQLRQDAEHLLTLLDDPAD